MHYIQYYNRDAQGTLYEACGDRAVIIIDGRERAASVGAFAATEGIRRGYAAWAVFRGPVFTRSVKVSGPHTIYKAAPDTSAASAAYGN